MNNKKNNNQLNEIENMMKDTLLILKIIDSYYNYY